MLSNIYSPGVNEWGNQSNNPFAADIIKYLKSLPCSVHVCDNPLILAHGGGRLGVNYLQSRLCTITEWNNGGDSP